MQGHPQRHFSQCQASSAMLQGSETISSIRCEDLTYLVALSLSLASELLDTVCPNREERSPVTMVMATQCNYTTQGVPTCYDKSSPTASR